MEQVGTPSLPVRTEGVGQGGRGSGTGGGLLGSGFEELVGSLREAQADRASGTRLCLSRLPGRGVQCPSQ